MSDNCAATSGTAATSATSGTTATAGTAGTATSATSATAGTAASPSVPNATAVPITSTPNATARPRNFSLPAPAKLNLALGVSPRIIDGKHLLTSVFSTIRLHDSLTFSYDPSQPRQLSVELHCDPHIAPLQLPPERNIVTRAVQALEQASGIQLPGRLGIRIDKRIPAQAGLGGGSSNAATTLMAAAAILGIDRLSEPVLTAARQLGADVSFFLYGGCAVMGGFGDQLLRQLHQPRLDIVLVQPPGGISTADAYRAFDADPQPMPDIEALAGLLEARASSQGGTELSACHGSCPVAASSMTAAATEPAIAVATASAVAAATEPAAAATAPAIAAVMANNLSPAACSLMPGIQPLIDELSAQPGVLRAMLTGSGSVVFGICADQPAAAAAAGYFQANGLWAAATETAAAATAAVPAA